ncbi:histidinol-phosphatase [Kordiimonas sediminis]|uniref:Histidinol-phosphatase n=1 Tax=Kordiimonas sediminis TaxID=1735581 RepID=A0A919AJU9_9PROT|nr:histidinol-phosphatase [Kordiimonas sediminis]GHF11226.1 histidinol-phosphatase [Kordiimonas sediminis]
MTQLLDVKTADELADFAEKLADAASDVTMKWFRKKVDIVNKEDEHFDPVTVADRDAETAIRALIEQHYPDHGIIGEEHGIKEANSAFTWVLDPVDGTRAFISGLPTWGTLIALLFNGIPVIGVIEQPYLRERYVGKPGIATLNGEPITTRPCTSLAVATISTTDPALFRGKDKDAFMRLLDASRLVRYGMDCYAYAILSSGYMDVVAETGLQIYDMMALIPIIRGAGGIAVSWTGAENPGEDGTLLALGDSALYRDTLDLLRH